MSGSFDFERSARSALPNEGFNDQPLTILGMFDASLAALSTSTAPEILATVTNGIVLKWDHGDTASSYIQIPFTIPDWYVQESDDIVLIVPARKVDSGGDENTDLCLQAQLYWQKPGQLNTPDQQSATATAPVAKTTGDTSQKSLTTPAKALMAGANTSAATSNTTGWFEYEINLGVRLHAEGKEISRGSLCNLRLGPNETVGSSDMDVEIGIPRLAIRRHARSDAFIERT